METREPMTQQEIIDAAMCFDMGKVTERYSRDHDIPLNEALAHEKELKRFLALAVIHTGHPLGMRGQVDELWHTFIFFTKEYFDFCGSLGSKYIHHVPETGDEPVSGDDYSTMLALYEKTFGEKPPEDIWPILSRGDGPSAAICSASCRGCGSCSSCGSGCAGCSRCSTGPQ